MIFHLSTSELLSTFFPTWLWQGREWIKGRIPKYDNYWGNAHAHPVLSSYYPPSAISSALCAATKMSLDRAYCCFIAVLASHMVFCLVSWYIVLTGSQPVRLLGAITIAFGAYSLKQQPCIIYTLAWFPLTLHANPFVSAFAVGMVLLAGYYPFAIYLLPISLGAHLLWYGEVWLVFGILIGLPQIIPFLKYLPKTVKRINDKCESPEVERRFYVGVLPILLIPMSSSRIWPLALASALFSLGLWKNLFPRVHQRWLIVLQFCVGWMAVNGLNNINLGVKEQYVLIMLHCADLYWHNRDLLPPTPFCELWDKPSRAFNTKLTRFLEKNLGDYRVAGLPFPLFTGLVNGFKTMGYQGSMQLRLMAKWRGTSGSHGVEELSQDDLTRYRVRFAFSRKRSNWLSTTIPNLYRNPQL